MMCKISLQYDTLSGLVLPSKRAFDNMNKEFLEKRKVALNTYLQVEHHKTVLFISFTYAYTFHLFIATDRTTVMSVLYCETNTCRC